MKRFQVIHGFVIAIIFQCVSTFADQPKLVPDINAVKIADQIYMLEAEGGGNMGLFIGSDGTFLIDDHFAPLTQKLLATIQSLGGDKPKFLINTHYHPDHTGGNANLSEAGTLIVAHDNVREILEKGYYVKAFNMKRGPSASEALPVISFSEEVSFHINGDRVKVFHVPTAHTNGDAVIYFDRANVLHTGDIFFNGFYPFIDVDHGGSLKGMIAAVDRLINLTDEETRVIPGHGPLAARTDLQRYRDMLVVAYTRIGDMKKQGLSIDQAVAKNPFADIDKDWGAGHFSSEQWLKLIYDSVE